MPCKQVALATKNGEFEVYTIVHKNSSTANDNVKRSTFSRSADAPDIESCKRSAYSIAKAGVVYHCGNAKKTEGSNIVF